MDDSFIKQYIGELLRSLRTQYLIDLIKPYTRLELAFLAKVRRSYFFLRPVLTRGLQQLNVENEEVEELLIGLILEGKVEGRIDQVAMRLELEPKYAFRRVRRLFHDSLDDPFTDIASRRSATALWINGRRPWIRYIPQFLERTTADSVVTSASASPAKASLETGGGETARCILMFPAAMALRSRLLSLYHHFPQTINSVYPSCV